MIWLSFQLHFRHYTLSESVRRPKDKVIKSSNAFHLTTRLLPLVQITLPSNHRRMYGMVKDCVTYCQSLQTWIKQLLNNCPNSLFHILYTSSLDDLFQLQCLHVGMCFGLSGPPAGLNPKKKTDTRHDFMVSTQKRSFYQLRHTKQHSKHSWFWEFACNFHDVPCPCSLFR